MGYFIRKKEELLKRIIYIFALITTFIYIIYRLVFTIPTNLGLINLLFGIFIFSIELIEAIEFFAYYLNVLRMSKKSPVIPSIDNNLFPDVDVFIATINEDEELLKNTIIACKNMKYPDLKKVHIYLCDDGRRDNIKKLCTKLKVNYITRDNNKGAKAGNYNNALSVTDSKLIATFDADMQPTPNFLMKTVPFFIKYNNIGFVQLPQSFNNPDIYQYRLSSHIPFEQDYFYHKIQLARNNINSTILCGTNVVISREALESVSGYQEDTITEDIATGMEIESNGYACIALSDIEAYGEAVNDLDGFIKQRSRWARGCIQFFKNHKIITNKKLSIYQKIDYISSVNYWLYGVKRMLYLFMPLLFTYFGIMVIDCNIWVFIPVFFTQYFIKRFTIDILEDNRRSSTWNKIYELVLTPIMCKEVLKEIFGFGSTKFEVTPKGKINKKMTKLNKYLLKNHIYILLLSILGIILALYKGNIIGYNVYLLPILWLLINIMYLIIVIIFDIRLGQNYTKFVPNKINKYSLKSYLYIFKGEVNEESN